MLRQTDDTAKQRSIRRDQLFGIEDQSYMFTIATTNMILRGDGKSNLHNKDFLKQNPSQLQRWGCSIGMMNPPYSQGAKSNPDLYEISFTKHLLDSLCEGARCIVIIPQSSVTDKNHRCKFINFEDDGYKVSKHIGLEETASAKDKRQHLLDVWFGRSEYESRFCVETTIEPDDEWLHAFYYFNDEIPTEADFEKTMADYLTFEFNMITHGRSYLFDNANKQSGRDNGNN